MPATAPDTTRATTARRAAPKPAAKPQARKPAAPLARARRPAKATAVQPVAVDAAAKSLRRARGAKPSVLPESNVVVVVADPAPVASAKAPASKPAKLKLVRDSFTMPADEYAVIGELKRRLLLSAHPAKKSELLRAGIKVLADMGDAALLEVLRAVPAIKTGRPKGKKGE